MRNLIKKKTFCDLDRNDPCASFGEAKVVILKCPYDLTVSYKRGTKKGPRAIVEASANMELFDEELKQEIYKIGIYTKPPLPIKKLSPDKMVEYVKKEVEIILRTKKMPVIIGGEHSVSIGAVWAANELCNDLSILYLDAMI